MFMKYCQNVLLIICIKHIIKVVLKNHLLLSHHSLASCHHWSIDMHSCVLELIILFLSISIIFHLFVKLKVTSIINHSLNNIMMFLYYVKFGLAKCE